MPLLSWIALGLIVGFAGARFVNKTGEGLRLDIAVGVAGAIVGGLLFNAARGSTTTAANLWSLSVAAIGSAVVLWAWHALARKA